MSSAIQIDDYTLLYECGRGAFGNVYLAKDSKERFVALKMVSLLGNAGDRELQALECYRKCSSRKHMLQIFEVVKKNGPPPYFYYTMEPADNFAGEDSCVYTPCTLTEVLKRQKTLSVQQTTELIGQILEDLAVIHENHLVHRDIKPANIFWVNKRAKLGDIGLLANEHSMTCNAGSPGFMPPADSGIDVNSAAVDLFAITRLIYVCLSGRSVNDYPDLEPTDDLMEHGCHLLSIMNLSTDQLPNMTVQDFQKKLGYSSSSGMMHGISESSTCCSFGVSKSAVCSAIEVGDSRSNKGTIAHPITKVDETRTDGASSLSTWTVLSGVASAGSWLIKNNISGSALAMGMGATGLGVMAGGATIGIAGAPLLGVAATAYLIKKLTEKK